MRLWDTAQMVAILWAIGYFIIKPLSITFTMTNPMMITAIVCSSIVLACVFIGFKRGK